MVGGWVVVVNSEALSWTNGGGGFKLSIADSHFATG